MRRALRTVIAETPPAGKVISFRQPFKQQTQKQQTKRKIRSILPSSSFLTKTAKKLRFKPSTRTVTGLNHFNITASPALIEQVKAFYIDIIGLTIGPRAQLDHDGYWLYAGNAPILHLSARQPIKNANPKGSNLDSTIETNLEQCRITCHGFFNHISLSCTGLQNTLDQLIKTQTPYRVAKLKDLHQTQVFLTDPAGIGVELTFFNETP